MMQLTPRIVAYVAHEEGLVPQAYLDSDVPPNWTWSIGLTAAAGVKVQNYINRPQPLDICLQAAIQRLDKIYLPAVAQAFAGMALNDAQVAAALGFHWNTGAIGHADWVKLARTLTDATKAETALVSNYTGEGALLARRQREAALFFHNTWPADLRCPVYSEVTGPAYHPRKPVLTDLLPVLQSIMGGH